MRRGALLLAALMAAFGAAADDDTSQADGAPPSSTGLHYTEGLSVVAEAGALWADDATAMFYAGLPDNVNTINRVLHSNYYGQRIWQSLFSQGLISSAIGSYEQLQVVEYPSMYYRTSYQVGIGLRYGYSNGLGWLLRFGVWQLTATGAFNLSSDNGTGILGNHHQYIRCGILGKEERINIDLAVSRTIHLTSTLDMEVDVGVNVNNTKVKQNAMEIGGTSYSILDVWGGHTPDYGIGTYDYINQGGIGLGGFATLCLGYRISQTGTIQAFYTCCRARTVLEGYSAIGWHHCAGIRLEMNNFSFFER